MTESPGITYDAGLDTYFVDPGVKTSAIKSLIAEAGDGATIHLNEGTHYFTETLDIKRGHITLTGAGEDLTTVVIDQFDRTRGIKIAPKDKSTDPFGTLQSDASRDDKTITLGAGHDVQAGDVLRIYQANDVDWFLSYGGDNTEVLADYNHYVDAQPLRESLVRVEAVDGDVVRLEHAVAYDMSAGVAQVERVHLLENVTLSDMTITYALGKPDADLIDNALPAYEKYMAVQAVSTDNLHVENVTIEDSASIALEIRQALEPVITDFTADGTHNKGGGKNGYGLHIGEVFYGAFENLEFYDMRHGLIFSSWDAEAYNEIHISYMNRDVNLHGSPDHTNTVIVDLAEYSDGYRLDGNTKAFPLIGLFSSTMHPHTDVGENKILFKYAEGGARDDIIHADHDGAYLAGNGGNDTLYGGKGDDILLGGDGDDWLYGRNGEDLLDGGSGADRLYGQNDSDVLYGGDGDDYLRGNGGDDFLEGGTGNDTLRGYEGNDILIAGSGNDRMQGGEGADIFSFIGDAVFDGLNRILDFNVGEGDVISFSDVLDGFDPLASAVQDFIKIRETKHTYVEVDRDGTGDAYEMEVAVRIENLTGVWENAETMVDQGALVIA